MIMQESNEVRVKNEPICYSQANKTTMRSYLEQSIKSDSTRIREDISRDSIHNKPKRQSILVKEEPIHKEMQTSKSHIEVEVNTEEKYKEFANKTSIAFLNEETTLEINVSIDKQRYKCDLCQKRFTSSANLNNHRRIHTGEKPFECDFCLRRFTQLSHLQNHRRTHTGEKPFECEFCQIRFTQLSNLLLHRRTHTGEKPFECEICQKRFHSSSALGYHRKTHTGDKRYECEVCQKRFIQLSNLEVHRRTHTEQNN